jgi:protein-S-isoprenylcysteine O-methyltransferase Ste14
MKATAFEFRFRFLIHAMIFVLGFSAPWDRWLHLDSAGPNAHVWGTLSARVAMLLPGTLSIAGAFNLLLALGGVCALGSAWLRTWASAYMGAATVHANTMYGERVVAGGPYRYLRNPLYVGIFIHTFALALFMPPSGAVFCIVATGLFELRLIFGEEAFLGAKLGESYRAYCARVPRLFPALRARVAASAARPAWGLAFLSEIYMWGVVAVFAMEGYRYNARPIVQGILISLGASLVVRALLPRPTPPQESAAAVD